MHAEHAIGGFDIEHRSRVPGDGGRSVFKARAVLRALLLHLTLMLLTGCTGWPPEKMLAPVAVPSNIDDVDLSVSLPRECSLLGWTGEGVKL